MFTLVSQQTSLSSQHFGLSEFHLLIKIHATFLRTLSGPSVRHSAAGRTLAAQQCCFSSWPTCRFSRLFGLSIAGAGAIALKRSTPWVVVLLSERTRALENARDCQARFSALSHHVSRILRFWERTLIKSVEHPKTHAWNLVITVFKKPQVNKVKYRPNLNPNFEPKVSPKWA